MPAPPKVPAAPTGPDPKLWANYSDEAPDESEVTERQRNDALITGAIDRLDILEAYSRYCGKMVPNPRGRTEGIKISCPMPSHPDKDPSAWISTDKQTWYCGGCNVGGDKYDLAALSYGYSLSSIRDKGTAFGELRDRMAADQGLIIERDSSGDKMVYQEADTASLDKYAVPEVQSPAPVPVSQPSPTATVPVPGILAPPPTPVSAVDPDAATEYIYPALKWQDIATPGTFLHEYMTQVVGDDVPEEYHFWYAMSALSLICGKGVYYPENPKNVYSNIFVCLLGTTGTGKSKSRGYITKILREVAPFDPDMQPPSTGVRLIQFAGSAEAFIHQFQNPIRGSAASPSVITGYASVRGLAEFPELRTLVQKSSAIGSTYTSRLIEFFDSDSVIENVTRTTGSLTAQDAHCSVIAGAQPELLKELLTADDINQGFVNRWLFVGGPRKKKQLFSEAKPDLTAATAMMKNIYDWSYRDKQVQFTDGAKEMLNAAWVGHIQADQDKHPLLMTRIDLYAKKLCLIFAINERTQVIDERIMGKFLAMYPYLLGCMELQSRAMTGKSKLAELEEEIVKVIDKFGPNTASQIKRRLPRDHRAATTETVVRACEGLVKGGEISSVLKPQVGAGRPAKWFCLQSHLDGTHPLPDGTILQKETDE